MVNQRTPDNNVKETAREARQGPLGKPVLWVLIGGLLLALFAWGGAEMFGESTDNKAMQGQNAPTTGQNKPSDQATPPTGDQPTTNAPAEKPTPQTGSGGDTQGKPQSIAPQ
ncbi:hypothetical protein [Phyllobacterium bourgognense]|uniref:Uncharacterized protein n=1 Tax=Phyllobacterium bourgognense TaxID=314236 RepID=A0A368YF13_9HYPH|nr:hypothetical protein [Phyllobacterium bourgognense]RCW78831.1 hypothetical protein C7476_12116 [Phyllobacterium bourgognense]